MSWIVHTTQHFQRLAAATRGARRRPVLGAQALLVLMSAGQVHRSLTLASALAAALAVMVALALPRLLTWLGWAGLAKHCWVIACRSAAGRANTRVRALARALRRTFLIELNQVAIICMAAAVIIGNRLLPTHCISPRLVAQRPN